MTVNLETAKKLKEAGCEQKADKFWATYLHHDQAVLYHENPPNAYDVDKTYAAYSTDELLARLPRYTRIEKALGGFNVHCPNDDTSKSCTHGGENLPNVLASVWLWLRKEGVV